MGSGGKGGGGGGSHDYFATIAGLVCAGPVSALVAIVQDKKVIWPTAADWIFASGEVYEVGDLVQYGGMVWRCIEGHVSHPDWPPGVAPEWERYVLRRTDPGVGNPTVLTVPGLGTAILYWGTADQVLDPVSEPAFAAVHPPYRRQCFVILKNWLSGRERTSAPNIEVIVAREPVQEVVTGPAAALDLDHQANPVAFEAEVITDPVFGLGLDASLLDAPSWQATADALTVSAATTHLSPVLNREQTLRAIAGELLEYFDGWHRFDAQGRILAGRWEHHEAPPAFTPATTIDHHDLIEEVALDAEGWSATGSAASVRFKDRLRAFKDNAVRVASVFNRSVTGDARERSVDRPWVTRVEQAAVVAAELARLAGEPGLSGTLVVRREKCVEIEPGTRFLLTHTALGLSVICRCESKTIDPPPAMRVSLRYRLERALAPAAVPPLSSSFGPPGLPGAELVSLFEFLQPPPQLAGSDATLLVLAARTSAVTVSMRIHLREADGDLFYEIGQQSQWAVRGELYADYAATEAMEDNSENLRVDLDPATVEPDRLTLQETQSADAVNDDALLVFILRASNPTQFEILTLKEIRIATGEAFYRLKVRRARFGTSRLAFLAGDRAWIVRRAALVFHRHGSFRTYALSGTTTTFRLQARNLFGREADLADTTQCPNRTFAFGSGGLWVPAAPSGLTVSTTLTDYVLSWSDNSTNEAGFRIEYSTDGTTWTSAGTVGPGLTSASIPGPPYDQTVFWRVIAFNGAGESLGSPTSSGYLPSGA
jgi:hypothetical protein